MNKLILILTHIKVLLTQVKKIYLKIFCNDFKSILRKIS